MLLTFDDGGFGRMQRCAIPRDGLELGRGSLLFDAPLSDRRLAPRHAEIRRDGARVVIRNLDGSALLRINGQALSGDHTLVRGDVLRLGDTLLVYSVGTGDPEEEADCGCAGLGMAAVRRSVDTVAPHKHSVVVTGETGTGKEAVAERIHEKSGRKGPFVAVNCAMFSEALLASELFGHTRGAFTGAVGENQGLFRAANHGTLLLDEMSDMPLSLQSSLLRVLETGAVRPVGSSRDIPVNTRIVATSNREIIELVHAERFRADLYARLAQWTIRVPPLRERREDIHALTRFLMSRSDSSRRRVTPDLGEALLIHDWPLNVRGLLNTLAIAAIASPPGQPLGLVEEVQMALWSSRTLRADTIAEAIVDVDRDSIERAMASSQGRVATVARALGVSRPRLYRLFAIHGIDPESYRPAGPDGAGREGVTRPESARDIARDAARDRARDAERDDARDSQRDVTRDTGRDAARDTVRDTVREIERDLAPTPSPTAPNSPSTPPKPGNGVLPTRPR